MKSFRVGLRVWVLAVLSSVVLWGITQASGARAHEVLPAIADMRQDGSELVFDVEANLETFIAQIDQSEVSDTNDAPQADRYDALRAMDPAALEEAFRAFWPQLAEQIDVTADGARLPLTLDSVTVQGEDLVATFAIDGGLLDDPALQRNGTCG